MFKRKNGSKKIPKTHPEKNFLGSVVDALAQLLDNKGTIVIESSRLGESVASFIFVPYVSYKNDLSVPDSQIAWCKHYGDQLEISLTRLRAKILLLFVLSFKPNEAMNM